MLMSPPNLPHNNGPVFILLEEYEVALSRILKSDGSF